MHTTATQVTRKAVAGWADIKIVESVPRSSWTRLAKWPLFKILSGCAHLPTTPSASPTPAQPASSPKQHPHMRVSRTKEGGLM